MKIQMRAQISGTRNGREWPRVGQIIDLPNDEAERLIKQGLAVEFDLGAPDLVPPKGKVGEVTAEPIEIAMPAEPKLERSIKAAVRRRRGA